MVVGDRKEDKCPNWMKSQPWAQTHTSLLRQLRWIGRSLPPHFGPVIISHYDSVIVQNIYTVKLVESSRVSQVSPPVQY